MALLNKIFSPASSKTQERQKHNKMLRNRICRIEEMESRELLSATPYEAPDPINVGVVYHEDYYEGYQESREDDGGDTFIVSWNGGAEGTTLDRVVIDLTKTPGLGSNANIFFNPDGQKRPNGYGSFHDFDMDLEENDGNGITAHATVSEDGKTLIIDFIGFTSEKVFHFKIDIDEHHGGLGMGMDRHVSGKEMEGAHVTSTFSAKNYEKVVHKSMMVDAFRFNEETGLDQLLPPDEYADMPNTLDTAGASATLETQKPLRGSISGFVYEDLNNDGVKDSGEAGIGGLTLELFYMDGTGKYVTTGLTTATAADGSYCFNDIPGGVTYLVIETQPEEYADGLDTPGTIGDEIVGESREPDKLGEIHIGAGEHGYHYNFGELKRASIAGNVYHDRNNDGIRDAGEEGIQGVTVKLQVLVGGVYVDVAGKTTRTDADGKYSFDGLDPYQVYRVVEVDQPSGFFDGKDSVGWIGRNDNYVGRLPAVDNDTIEGILLEADQHGKEYNFGEYKKGSISGNVYEDDDNDGKKDPGEKGIPGVEIMLCVLNERGEKETVAVTVTDENGRYSFENLEPGKTYCVTETNPEGYCDGKDTVGTVDGEQRGGINVEIPVGKDQIHDITLGSGENGVNYNFAENRVGKISGFVYNDADKNGTKNSGENGIEGVLLTLWVWSDADNRYIQTSKTALTNATGYYEFTGLCPFKKYQVRETQPTDFDDGRESVGSIDGAVTGTLPENDVISEIALPPGGNGENYNFGETEKPVPVVEKGSISGHVYVDADKDGTRDTGERGIGGVTLTLWKLVNDRYVDTGMTTTTNADGFYHFNNLDPNETYQISETQPLAFDDGQETIGSLGGLLSANDKISGILVQPGQHGTNYNFGEWEKQVSDPDPEKGSISGHVYVDVNKDGARDNGERGIAGVTLTLWKLVNGEYVSTGRTAQTDSNGFYIFADLDPNETYQILETQPAAFDDGGETVGSLGGSLPANDVIAGILVAPGQHGTNYNFGEWEKQVSDPDPEKGSISGYVYLDVNPNGRRDVDDSGSEPGIGGVTLTLWKLVAGEYVNTGMTTTTNADGFYRFNNLDPNETYQVSETQPDGYDDGEETVGSLGGGLPANDVISGILVEPGDHGLDYNFGETIPVVDPLPTPSPPPKPSTPPSLPYTHWPSPSVGFAPGAGAPYWQAPSIGEQLTAGYGGGGLPSGYSWHLSVVNAGYPRTEAAGVVAAQAATQRTMLLNATTQAEAETEDLTAKYVSVAWEPLPMNQSAWYIRDKNGKVTKRYSFGPEGGTPLAADFSGDGLANLAVYHNGHWYIDLNGNGEWDKEDLWCELGTASDQPVVGDWDGDGKADIGIFGPQWSDDAKIVVDEPGLPSDLNVTITARPKNLPPATAVMTDASHVRAMKHSTAGHVRLDLIDHVFQYGGEGDKAFSADFSGDGITKIGIYRNGKWYIDYNGNGRWDADDIYVDSAEQGEGLNGIPVVGDWSGDGVDKIGVYVNGVWHLDTAGDFRYDTQVEFGEAGDKPVVGDFDGDGISQLALFRAEKSDSLQARNARMTPTQASPTMAGAPRAFHAEVQGLTATQYGAGTEATESSVDQGTLPEEMQENSQEKTQRHGRSMRTPYTSAPLQRN